MIPISSKDNQYLKLARSLHQKKGRSLNGCFIVEGLRLAKEALDSSLEIRFAFIAEDADVKTQALADQLEERFLPVYILSSVLLAGITATEHSQGIVLVAAIPRSENFPPKGHCFALCDRVADPGNMGNIIRNAYAAEVSGLILTPGCADIYNPKTVRAAMGALFRLPICIVNTDDEAYEIAANRGLAVYATTVDGSDIRVMEDELRKAHLWVLGSEAQGVSAFWQEKAEKCMSLPMRQDAESLNVASAAAVLFYQSFFIK